MVQVSTWLRHGVRRRLRLVARVACIAAAGLLFARSAVAQDAGATAQGGGATAQGGGAVEQGSGSVALPALPTSAQASDDAGTGGASQLPGLSVSASTGDCSDESLYDHALDRYGDQRFREAHALLRRFLDQCPNHPRARDLLRRVDERIERMDSSGGTATPGGLDSAGAASPAAFEASERARALNGPERPELLPRIELSLTQAVFGLANGMWICGIAGCGTQGFALAGLLTPTLFATTAALASWNGVRAGQTLVINYGSLTGAALGPLMLATAFLYSSASREAVASVMPISTAVGTVAGSLVAALAPPTAGHVSLMTSMTLWGTGIVSLFTGAAFAYGARADGQILTGMAMGSVLTFGLVGGVVGHFYRVTRGRMFIVDLSTGVGALLGIPLGLLDSAGYGRAMLVTVPISALVAWGVSFGLSHRMDYPDNARPPPVQTSFLPIGPNGQPGASMFGVF